MSELLIKLDRRSPVSLHAQIEAQLKAAIQAGRLSAGDRLPSTRVLAGELSVARGVVVESYEQLRASGYLDSRSRTHTTVSDIAPAGSAATGAPRAPATRVRWDFHPGYPDLDGFPRTAWFRCARTAIGRVEGSRLAYGDPRGDPALRTALAGHLGRSREVSCDPERVIVTLGFQQGLFLVCGALRQGGARRLAVEDPSLRSHRALIEKAGLEVVPVEVDDDGMRVEALEDLGVDGALLTPAHQFPLGAALSESRRRLLLDWAARRGAFVIEDDYDSEYRYDRDPLAALQGLAPDQVIYIGSASKVLAPGLRLGWMVVPASLYEATLDQRQNEGGPSPVFDQLTLAEFIETEGLYRHLRAMRSRYRRRRAAIVAALGEQLPDARLRGLSAGLHVLAVLPAGFDQFALADAARERGVGVHTLGWFRVVARPEEPGLLLGYASQSERSIGLGVRELAIARASM